MPVADVDAIRAAITPTTKLIWLETPTNPLLSIADIAAVAQVAAERSVKLLVDNTFASPALQQPLNLGADIALHSTTKYIGGHSDVVGGALLTNDEELDTAFAFLQNGAGAVPGPFDGYLTYRGIKTLALRMQRHSENAQAVAEYLAGHPPSRRRSTRGWKATRDMPWPPGRCVASAAWSVCGWPEDARRHSTCAREQSFSFWLSPWAGWSP